MLLRTQSSCKDDRNMVAAVFNQMFRSALLESGYDQGMETDSVADAWNSRLQEGRAKAWRPVNDPPKDAEERRHRRELLRKLDAIAAELATAETAEDDGYDGNGEQDEESGPDGHANGDDDAVYYQGRDEEAQDVDNVNNMGTSMEAMNRESDVDEVSPDRRTTGPPLEMIHFFIKDAQGPDVVTRTSTKAFINHDNHVYQLGGRVYRAIINGKTQDVIICNKSQCRRCRKVKRDDELQALEVSKTKGLPFVYAVDFRAIARVGFEFNREVAAYNENYPKKMWQTKVSFSDGVRREVMVCVAADCEHCSGKEAVEERTARYLPGGRLYPLVKAAKGLREER